MGCLQSLKKKRSPKSNNSNLKNYLQSKSFNLPSIELISISFQENNSTDITERFGYPNISSIFKIENDKKNSLFHVCGIRSI